MKSIIFVFVTIFFFTSCSLKENSNVENEKCSQETLKYIDKIVKSGDGMGHGPDIGSGEWHSTIEFKLGLRGNKDIPKRGTASWCRFIESNINYFKK